MTSVSIREAAESDLPDILRAYRDVGIDGGVSFTPAEARGQFALLGRYPSYPVYVAIADGAVVGTYSLVLLDKLGKRGARAGIVEDVAVLPEVQGKGIGRA